MTDSMFKFDNFDDDPFHKYLGMTLVERQPDYAKVKLPITENTPQGIGGSVHGGVLATMLDMCAVTAVFTNLFENSEPAGTADLQINYLRQARGNYLIAEAHVIKRGKQLCTVNVDIKNDQGILCTTGRILYSLRLN